MLITCCSTCHTMSDTSAFFFLNSPSFSWLYRMRGRRRRVTGITCGRVGRVGEARREVGGRVEQAHHRLHHQVRQALADAHDVEVDDVAVAGRTRVPAVRRAGASRSIEGVLYNELFTVKTKNGKIENEWIKTNTFRRQAPAHPPPPRFLVVLVVGDRQLEHVVLQRLDAVPRVGVDPHV